MERSRVDPQRALIVFGVLGIAAVAAAVLYRFEPTTAGFYPQCIFHALTGLDCPGCGATRAAHALLHGRFAQAFHFNPMLLLYAPVLAFGAYDAARSFVTHAPLRNVTTRPWLAWSVAFTVTGWWVVRNTPLWLG
ncbi:MAG: DUF2752 domain-containing protein [Acidobacteria bacterium]|nr:DUF2752 domain-containing protein [Acidobacteriota bacterium]